MPPQIPGELKKIKEAFADVREKEEIAGLLISEAQKAAKRVALFIVKGVMSQAGNQRA